MDASHPCIVDVYHGDTIASMSSMKANGIVGLIHKASQGDGSHDLAYASRRKAWLNGEPAIVDGKEVTVLWGAYHFNTGATVESQVNNFFLHAQPDEHTLMVLDFEDNRASNMTIHQCWSFLLRADEKLGRQLAIYSGNRLKDLIGQAETAYVQAISQHKLWLCQYGPKAVLPRGFSKWWLWQRWADGYGSKPIPSIPGLHSGVDLSVYEGTAEQLTAEWTGTEGIA